ncbi:dihydroxy-acid dehydratase [Cyphellophora europaea CBS 101466]|uniref:Dihydroxy-acid dehydratase n=1 Tax=Cyphellophora europaea (strain CBS 101466) TaxID=1220924 RepID=W2RSC7_CYPE1|nr:dihydroxy-acid dehydratase [Cyphellophora europaea CBS 101466]ETN39220.1 dihydroxy-acid dehydratase [Cyphellophora europaea CBS 101466]
MADAQQQQQQQQQYTTTTSETLRGQSQHEQQTSVNGGGPVSSNSRIPPEIAADYDLSKPISSKTGLRQGLAGYGDPHFSLFLRKVFIKALGYSDDSLSKPIIGIINTYSSFNPCHSNAPQLIEAAKRGILASGGLPVDFPTISIHESFSSPTSMYLRNLMSIDTEEMTTAQPVDAVIAIGGCDKTVPAQLMGCISANKPFLPLITGPMMPGSVKGKRVGACTDCRSHWAAYRAGTLDMEEIMAVNEELAPTGGTCGVMGTASTMACIVAALGLTDLRSGATAAAVSSARLRVAEDTGRRAVALLNMPGGVDATRPQALLTKESFENAITVLQAIGGSTNAVVHLMAIINRHPSVAGQLTLQDVDRIGRNVPLLVDLKPSGDGYMTDFHNAGGMLALMHRLRPLLHLNAHTYTGETLGQLLDTTPWRSFDYSERVVRPLTDPLWERSSLVVLSGNLAPGGAVMKQSASKDQRLLKHRGQAVVFEDAEDLARRIDDSALEVSRDSVLVLKGIGPVGNPGMPEAGLIPIPRKLGKEGVLDMLRISDGRMSGTAGGTIVLHVCPEAADLESVFGVVRTGDRIVCDVEQRVLQLEVADEEIQRRVQERKAAKLGEKGGRGDRWIERKGRRGYRGLYERRVNQANEGCDFDFLRAVGGEYEE